MPQMSVAIPAYKPQHLSQAIASVLSQTFEDYELLISDDCHDGHVRAVVEQFRDPRIRLIKGPQRGLVPNSVRLWDAASTDLLKFVFDDDFLLPFCLAALAAPMLKDPALPFAFNFRHIVDEKGVIVESPEIFTRKSPVRFEKHVMPMYMLSNLRNPIGEPSNIIIRRSAFPDASCLGQFCGIPIRHMIDVAFYLNAAQRGDCVGVPEFHSAFRRHDSQVSSRREAPAFSAGLYEWEVFTRGSVQLGLITHEVALKALPILERAYRSSEASFPELAHRRGRLPELRIRLEAGETDLVDDQFVEEWGWADRLIRERLGETISLDANSRQGLEIQPATPCSGRP